MTLMFVMSVPTALYNIMVTTVIVAKPSSLGSADECKLCAGLAVVQILLFETVYTEEYRACIFRPNFKHFKLGYRSYFMPRVLFSLSNKLLCDVIAR